jgi:hypothetical protein
MSLLNVQMHHFARAPGLFYSTISHIEGAALKLFEDEDGLGQITKDGREIRIPRSFIMT